MSVVGGRLMAGEVGGLKTGGRTFKRRKERLGGRVDSAFSGVWPLV